MNKKLLTAMIGAAFAAGPMLAVQAAVTPYGAAQVEVNSADTEFRTTGDAPIGFDGISVEDRARGRFGIKASEDLKHGLKGLARFEWRIDTTDNDRGGNSMTARESWVGLQGSWGTFQAGNLRSAYKYTGGVTYDPFTATVLEARGNGGMSGNDLSVISGGVVPGSFGHNSFLNNSLGYISPTKQGVMWWLTYSPDEDGNARGSEGDYSFAVKFMQPTWEVFLSAINMDESRTTGRARSATGGGLAAEQGKVGFSYSAYKIGGKFSFGGCHTLVGQFEMGEMDDETANPSTTGYENDTIFLGWRCKLGNNQFVVSYGMTEWDFGTNPGTGAPAILVDASDPAGFWNLTTTKNSMDVDFLQLGVIHHLSKTTRVWVGYRSTEYSDLTVNTNQPGGSVTAVSNPEDTNIALGIRKDF